MRRAFLLFLPLVCAAAPKIVTVSEGTNISATVSPDRKTIIMDLQETLWSLPLAGGAAKRLTDPFLEPARPAWSPKGDLVAFQSFKGGTFHIWVMKPDGTGIRQLTEGHGDDREPSFSPDGKRIAFSSDRAMKGSYDIWAVDVETRKLTQWTTGPDDEYEPAWSPTRMEIAFASAAGIQAVDAAGKVRMLIPSRQGVRLESPSWAPDGNRVAYTQIVTGGAKLMVSGQQVGSADDVFPFPPTWISGKEILYTGNGKIFATAIGGSTRTIPFEAKFELNRAPYKHRAYDFDSTAERPVKGIMFPALSPDGKRIVFEALNQLWLMDVGGKPRQLTNDAFYKQSPAWSPDGTKIAYSSDKAGTADIYILDLATRAEQRVTKMNDSAEINPAWSRDGKKLAFQKQDGTSYTIDLASGEVKEIVRAGFEPGASSWSPNGKTIAMAALKPYTRRFREGTNQIATVDVATGAVTYTEPAPYKSISSRGVDGPVYSPDGSKMAFVMDGYLWTRPVDANGAPTGEARPVNEEMTDAPSFSGDGKRILYLSGGKLRIVAADGSGKPETVPLDFTWRRAAAEKRIVIHAGRLWDGLGADERTNVDVTIVGRRIQKVEAHGGAAHRGAEVIDASDRTVLPGYWETHNHNYGGLSSFGDRAGRIWLAYGFTALQSQGEQAYGQMETKESFASGARVGPRFFASGEIIDGERSYYSTDAFVTTEKALQMQFARAQALEYDNLKTYVRLPHDEQLQAMKFAHEKLGVWIASHYGLPGLAFGMDGMTHVSATSRWGYSYTRSYGDVTYGDIRTLFPAAGEFMISTPFAAAALYAEDPDILNDPRLAALNPPWQQAAMVAARDRAVAGNQAQLESLRKEEETLLAVKRAGGAVILGTDSPLPGLSILNHLGLRAEVKYGFQPWEALQTVTLHAAQALGYGKDLGSIEPGKLADLVIVSGDPLRSISDAAKIDRVMVDGRVYTTQELMAPYGAK